MQGKVNGFSFYSPMTDRRTQIAAHKNRRTQQGDEEAWQARGGEGTELSPSELGLIRKYLWIKLMKASVVKREGKGERVTPKMEEDFQLPALATIHQEGQGQ